MGFLWEYSVCLRMNRSAYIHIAKRAEKLELTTGEYVERLVRQDRESDRSLRVPALMRD